MQPGGETISMTESRWFVGIWVSLDSVEDWWKGVWAPVVRAAIAAASEQPDPLTIVSGRGFGAWAARWPGEPDPEGVFAEVPSEQAAREAVARLGQQEIPGLLAIDRLRDAPGDLALDGWYWKGAVLQLKFWEGSDFHNEVGIPMVYARDDDHGFELSYRSQDSFWLRGHFAGLLRTSLRSPTGPADAPQG